MKNHHQLLWAGLQRHTTYATLFWLVCLCGIFLFGQTPVYAQQTSATLVGTITDTTGAVAPNARIKAVNLATGAAREATSDDSGNYSLPFLPAGDYEVTITAQGYKTRKVERLTLQVSQTLRQGFTMDVGAGGETVKQTATGGRVRSEKSTVGAGDCSPQNVRLHLTARASAH